MKRLIAGFFWFFVFQVSMRIAGGAYFGAIQGAGAGGGFAEGFEAGQAAGQAFSDQFGGVVLVIALAVAALGTYGRVLPGTRTA